MPITVTTGGPIDTSAATASAISDYASLLIDAGEYAGATDIAHVFQRLVALAEIKLNRLLRVADMETTATLTLVDGDVSLPSDFLEARVVLGPAGQGLNAWSLAELDRRFRNYGGYPSGYSVVGSTVRVRPTSDGDITISYYAKLPSLTPDSPTNWLLQKAPDVYLWAVCEEIAIWKKDAAGVQAARALKEEAVSGLVGQDFMTRWGNGQVVIDGYTP